MHYIFLVGVTMGRKKRRVQSPVKLNRPAKGMMTVWLEQLMLYSSTEFQKNQVAKMFGVPHSTFLWCVLMNQAWAFSVSLRAGKLCSKNCLKRLITK